MHPCRQYLFQRRPYIFQQYDVKPVQTNLKHMDETWKCTKKTQDCWAARIPCKTRRGKTFLGGKHRSALVNMALSYHCFLSFLVTCLTKCPTCLQVSAATRKVWIFLTPSTAFQCPHCAVTSSLQILNLISFDSFRHGLKWTWWAQSIWWSLH